MKRIDGRDEAAAPCARDRNRFLAHATWQVLG
jgi:hypothetical protein